MVTAATSAKLARTDLCYSSAPTGGKDITQEELSEGQLKKRRRRNKIRARRLVEEFEASSSHFAAL